MSSSKTSYLRKKRFFPNCTLLLSPSNVRWMTGFDVEFPGSAVVLLGDVDYLIVAELEYERAKEKVPWMEVVKGPRRALWRKAEELCGGPYFADLSYLDFRTAMMLIEKLGAGDVSKKVRELRMSKDEEEVARISKALEISEKAFLESWKEVDEGLDELSAAGVLEAHMREFGAENFAFPTIVAFGESSSHPHAVPGRRKFSYSKPALFDFGAVYGGFRSDITRTYVPDKQPYLDWFNAVIEAINAALKALKPGIRASEVDKAARSVIAEYGFAENFQHGLGHGVGADVHEPPYLSPTSTDVVPKGSVVTIEPGLYFRGLGGVRIEQLVLSDNKPYVLNKTTVVWW
ncbi:MAG: M24 family metallopeptidase [Crenarchaeota archaeon]|nr:M24 family metallopeptidase [Thermoproteota archaeon]